MKIALVHDYIKEYGGAERVLEVLHEMYPDAPVYTLVYCPEFLGPHRERFADWDIRPSMLQYVPFKQKLISPFRLLAPFIFSLFDFSEYDVVIVSATGAYSPNCINLKPQTKNVKGSMKSKDQRPLHVCYYHTPPRYLYGLSTAREWKKYPLIQFFASLAFSWLRKVDIASSKNVDVAIANSHNVAQRIKKFYGKEAVAIYPPVEIPNPKSQIPNKSQTTSTSYYLAGGRLARPKHIDLIIQACAELGVPLKVFGKSFAGYGEELKQISNIQYPISNIQFVGEVTDEEKTRLMKGATAYIFAAEDEDFGMLPVEAMAVGTPVIAYKSGGPKESVVEGKTGVFFDELTVKSLIKAVKRFETLRQAQGKKLAEECLQQSKKFSKVEFIKEISQLIQKSLS